MLWIELLNRERFYLPFRRSNISKIIPSHPNLRQRRASLGILIARKGMKRNLRRLHTYVHRKVTRFFPRRNLQG